MPLKSFKPTRERKQRRRANAQKHQETAGDDGQGGSPAPQTSTVSDPNVEIIVPLTAAEKAEKRRQQLREELKAQQPKMSAKKQKRFNKYIETKLKKEETAAILEKLAETKVDTSLLTSTRSIGASRESKKQQIKRALLEEQAGINLEANRAILYEERRSVDDESFGIPIADESAEGSGPDEQEAAPVQTQIQPALPFSIGVAVGAGLKRPLDSESFGPPVIKRIKKNRRPKKAPLLIINEPEQSEEDTSMGEAESEEYEENSSSGESGEEEEEEEWRGFSDDATEEESGSDTSESSEGSEDESESDEPVGKVKKGRSEKAAAFKEWALAQRRTVVDGGPALIKSNIEALMEAKATIVHIPRRKEEDMTPPPEELRVPEVDRKVHYVNVERAEDIQTARLALPVVAEEQQIMEAIHSNPCVVICGETGSGKTTQVPQFLYEAGYGSPGSPTPGMIGVTQPRRVAAVSMAKRVGTELGEGGKDKVSYQIRFDGTVNANTAIKFMTDGVLLRELAEDFLLSKYSAIIIDEAHERSINTDILIGVMSRVVRLRETMSKKKEETKPLRLIVMSATLRVSDFVQNTTLFSTPPPLLKIDARQHPVTPHFSRRTASDYVEEAYKKVCRINRRLPPGGILVFLTGQNEILALQRKLKQVFPVKSRQHEKRTEKVSQPQVKVLASEAIVENEDVELGQEAPQAVAEDEEDPISDDEDQNLGDEMGDVDVEYPLHVLPLYSLLPTREQLKVFEQPPEGTRLCVLATNVAETSLTIPGIRYVVDCGRSKERHYDKTTGVQSFRIQWISKASAEQRAGRAGRTGPGHCYKLYSSAIYETEFEKYAKPELLRMPIEGVVLQMKAMNIDTIVNFPFPSPPDRQSLHKAEKLLGYLRAIASDGALTELGRTMSYFPLSPRFAKILMIGQQHGCLPYVIAIVSALSVGDIFIPQQQLGFDANDEEEQDKDVPSFSSGVANDAKSKLRSSYFRAHTNFAAMDPESDVIKLLAVVCAFEYEKNAPDFCTRSFIRLKAMEETRKLRQQVSKIVMDNCPGVLPSFQAKLPPPSKLQIKALKQIVAAGFIDNIAIRADLLPNSDFKLNHIKQSTQIPYITLFPSSARPSDELSERSVFLHQTSVLAMSNTKPEYVIYSELTQSVSGSGKVWMKPLTTIKGGQLAALAQGTPLITYSKPLESKPPKILPGSDGKKREVWVVPRIGAAIGKSGLGWSLPPQRMIQKREGMSQKWANE